MSKIYKLKLKQCSASMYGLSYVDALGQEWRTDKKDGNAYVFQDYVKFYGDAALERWNSKKHTGIVTDTVVCPCGYPAQASKRSKIQRRYVCCDICDQWYHAGCVQLKHIPRGKFVCPNCEVMQVS